MDELRSSMKTALKKALFRKNLEDHAERKIAKQLRKQEKKAGKKKQQNPHDSDDDNGNVTDRSYVRRFLLPNFVKPTNEVVTFVLGVAPDQKSFVVHKHAIIAHSPFFKAAFQSSMLEGTIQTMRLEDVKPVPFGLMVNYVYTDTIEYSSFYMDAEDGLRRRTGLGSQEDWDLLLLLEAWKLGERFLMPDFQNRIMRIIYHLTRLGDGLCSPGMVQQFCEEVTKDMGERVEGDQDVLRDFVVDLAAWSDYKAVTKYLPQQLCHEVCEVLKSHGFARMVEMRADIGEEKYFLSAKKAEGRR
ncbi:hypothetical protein VTL71DRAFT_4514 [Oculimacula yallundae]|uniref:BTB domain-containing protein n=1 Tax=Oculimacula yallundae TaxID=86028 RepID=A0ABR4C275_9HELO